MGRRKRVVEEPIVEQNIEEKITEVIEDTNDEELHSEIDFLIKILDKQFELAGVPNTTEELLGMDEETQLNILKGYKLNDDLYNEWYNYFIYTAKNEPLFSGVDEQSLQNIFKGIYDTWGLEFEPDKGLEDNDDKQDN